ncbi:oligopeptide transport system permease protein AppB [Thermacetogenium phaeum DSM 12270]|uniref:Oligopeptide transport system permease protein AppB n=1 Tax=Thermacetogenium phaeum (strain ATCC BAA-254 / DSM 26808 / PB) TaxID=1089553 RepID=K4LIF0_THEPS|nr:ABC transporter permease [Thermacetogenium phaeum]AFV12673.1 oligopeptide transport system permease protein AppB [Thermacetogenium phaeum DSM 12270]
MGLRSYLLRRGSQVLPLLFGISILAFLIIHLSPIDPVELYLGKEEAGLLSPQDRARLRASWGLDKPLPVQYLVWLGQLLHGNLGRSQLTGEPVAEVIGEHLQATLALMGISYLLIVVISIYFGVVSAKKAGSLLDHAFTALGFALYATPNFWLALILIYAFSLKLNIFPVCGTGYTREAAFSLMGFLHHLALPSLVLALTTVPWYSRFLRSSLLEVLTSDFILVARAKGLTERAVLLRHALRNALLPFLTLLGMAFPHLVGGSVVIETIFAWPGVGRLLVESALRADYPVLMGLVLLISTFVVLGNLLADVAYAVVDPRVRYGGES